MTEEEEEEEVHKSLYFIAGELEVGVTDLYLRLLS